MRPLATCKKGTKRYESNINNVVEVYAYDKDNESYGTAWFIDDKILITNYHVISFESKGERYTLDNIGIRFYDEIEYVSIEVNRYDSTTDIALLKYEGNHKHGTFKFDSNYKTGDECYVIGNFNNQGLSYKEGLISLSKVNITYNEKTQEFIQCQINIGQGDSGAPIINDNNKVIGMITLRTKNSSGVVEQGYGYGITVGRIQEIFSNTN